MTRKVQNGRRLFEQLSSTELLPIAVSFISVKLQELPTPSSVEIVLRISLLNCALNFLILILLHGKKLGPLSSKVIISVSKSLSTKLCTLWILLKNVLLSELVVLDLCCLSMSSITAIKLFLFIKSYLRHYKSDLGDWRSDHSHFKVISATTMVLLTTIKLVSGTNKKE